MELCPYKCNIQLIVSAFIRQVREQGKRELRWHHQHAADSPFFLKRITILIFFVRSLTFMRGA